MAASSDKFINLDEVVRDWAWKEFDRTATGRQKKLRAKDKREPRKFLHLEVDWSETRFHDETQWSPLRVADDEDASTGTITSGQNNVAMMGMLSAVRPT